MANLTTCISRHPECDGARDPMLDDVYGLVAIYDDEKLMLDAPEE
jgi:hypothetical protein